MDAIPYILFVLLFWTKQETTALQCHCDRCGTNASCTTDGVCFVAIRKSGSQLTVEQRQCVHGNELIPRDRPFICAPSVKHDAGIYPMCCTTDYCNKGPDPELAHVLQCHCDSCGANSSCTTDGVCFAVIRKSGNQLITEQRRCVHKKELIPQDRPFICAPPVKNNSGIYPMCCSTHYCNKEPDLEIFPGTGLCIKTWPLSRSDQRP